MIIVKPGTARRLGLRRPGARPRSALQTTVELPAAEMAEFARRFQEALGPGQPRWVLHP